MGKVYLIGAGPGDTGLITVRGLELLKICDCVVYDRLSSPELLSAVRSDCLKIYVGKEAGKHYKKQNEINEILIECALKYDTVVRLKEGDPFVFGRGGEEIDALTEHKIAYELVPGITSAVAVPEMAGIPVTHRGLARSFHVITGHTNISQDSPDYDYANIAGMEGTIVFLMGLSNLRSISENLIRGGKDPDTPAAVISEGTTPYQKTVRGALSNIADLVEKEKLISPAIIVIGETAAFTYDSKEYRRKAGVIATDALWKRLSSALDENGFLPIRLGKMEIIPLDQDRLGMCVKTPERYQWIVFTSQNAIRLYFDAAEKQNVDYRRFSEVKFAVIGTGTAAALRKYGFTADFIPTEYTVEGLAEELAGKVCQGDRIFVPRALQGNPVLSEKLKDAQAEVDDLAIYDVRGDLTEDIGHLERLELLLFASGSGVRNFADRLKEQHIMLPEHIKTACIGQVTADQVRKEFKRADIIATVSDVNGLVDAVKNQ